MAGVHQTYDADYSQSDDAHIFVLVALCDLPGPLHQVLLNVVQTPNNHLQRAQVMPPAIDRDAVLIVNGLTHFCQRATAMCRVYLNGQLLPLGTVRRVTHGDYVRVTIIAPPDDDTAARLAEDFHVPTDVAGMEYMGEHMAMTLANGQQGGAAIEQRMARASQAPRATNRTSSEAYWIGMSVYVGLTHRLK